MLRALRRITTTRPVVSRAIHSERQTGLWGEGLNSTLESEVADFTPEELSNRSRSASLLRLVESYRRHGHRSARTDPASPAAQTRLPVAALDPRRYGFALERALPFDSSPTLPLQLADASEKYDVRGILDFGGKPHSMRTMQEISDRLSESYTAGIGFEFMHLSNKHERRWIERNLELYSPSSSSEEAATSGSILTDEQRLEYHQLLLKSEGFERWGAKRFPTVKRYGLGGCDSLLVALSVLIKESGKSGIEDIVLAIPHRGRLNILTQLLDLDMRMVIRKMKGLSTLSPELGMTDDVLSHLVVDSIFPSSNDKGQLRFKVLPNPSHLEAATPVGAGYAHGLSVPFLALEAERDGKDFRIGDSVLSVSMHGDAAFAGQGVVYESIALPIQSDSFDVGGTVRIIVNNKIGYTRESGTADNRYYVSDVAKLSAPIFHVNADRIEDVCRAMSLACAFQRKFRKDVVIDLVCYRRLGHNELDEPAYTNPLSMQRIAALPSVLAIYEKELIADNLLTEADATALKQEHFNLLDKSLADAEKFTIPKFEMPERWNGMRFPTAGEWETEKVETGVDEGLLKEIGLRSTQVPNDFTIHPRLQRTHMSKRIASLESGNGIDFATAEALAIGSLMHDGRHVRLCGQDSGRGTFSQRHAVVVDQTTGLKHSPLQSLRTTPLDSQTSLTSIGTFEIVDSPLSEYAVVGFEQGLSYVSPDVLTIWEAQFGDFLNTAQVAVDNYFTSGETKWALPSAFTLLLPHGFDSAGPEHSSARIERFLQLSNEPIRRTLFVPNVHLVNITTAASYFHVLRRQLCRDYRKPLVIFSPKGILRLPAASSTLSELSSGKFQSVIDDPSIIDHSAVERVVLLSGKMYYDLVKTRKEKGLDSKIAFIRIEEISPFPYAALSNVLRKYASANATYVWAQEEPENAGAYTFVLPRLPQILPKGTELEYAGREASAAVAVGVAEYHNAEKEKIYRKIFE